jgi:hypothetical protein
MVALSGLVNTLFVLGKPSLYIQAVAWRPHHGKMRKRLDSRNGRKTGGAANRQAWEPHEDRTRTACGLRRILECSPSVFLEKRMKKASIFMFFEFHNKSDSESAALS